MLLVEFYAPWCGHCKKLAPEYEVAAQILAKEDPPLHLAKVDADEASNKELASKYDVKGFPTMKIFRKGGIVQDYQGPRDSAGIVDYVKKMAGPASKEIKTSEEMDALLKNHVAVVGVFKSLDEPEFKRFEVVAENLRSEMVFGHTTDGALVPDKGTPLAAPAVRLFKDFDEGFNDFADFDLEKLKQFLDVKSVPSAVEMSKDPAMRQVISKVFQSEAPKVLGFWDYKSDTASAFKEEFLKVASSKADDVKFIYGDGAENDQALKYFGVTTTSLPIVIIHDTKEDKKYFLEKTSADKITTFIDDFKAGKLTAHIKSEDIPAKNDESVTVLVAKNFDDIVFNSGKNVLIEFYAPWCGHCKTLAPIYEELGDHYEDDDEIIIAKLDATANDVPSSLFKVKGFPTLFFYSADGKVSPYDGNRTLEDLIKYVEAKRSSKAGAAPAAAASATDSSSEAQTDAAEAAEASIKAEVESHAEAPKDEL
eukprot:SM000015S01149  [mRNA]  locus=s15:75686:79594:- [translate_table: standard]